MVMYQLPRTDTRGSARGIITSFRECWRCGRRLGTIEIVFVSLAMYAYCALTYPQTTSSAPLPYRTAAAVSALSPEQAGKAEPVELRGVVTDSPSAALRFRIAVAQSGSLGSPRE